MIGTLRLPANGRSVYSSYPSNSTVSAFITFQVNVIELFTTIGFGAPMNDVIEGLPPIKVSSYPVPGFVIVIPPTPPVSYPSLSTSRLAKPEAFAPHPAGSTI